MCQECRGVAVCYPVWTVPMGLYLTDSRKGARVRVMQPPSATALRAAGLRVTRPRVAVLEALESAPHADTGAVIDAVRTSVPTVSHQAVYDCLAALTAAGLVRRIQPAGSTARYELRVGDNHHHLVCRSCGGVADIDCATGAAPCLTPEGDVLDRDGFVVDEAEVIYWGVCAPCAAARHGDPDSIT